LGLRCTAIRWAKPNTAEAVRPTEGLGRKRSQVIDVLGATRTERRLEHRVGQDAAMERILEAVDRFLTGMFAARRHRSTLDQGSVTARRSRMTARLEDIGGALRRRRRHDAGCRRNALASARCLPSRDAPVTGRWFHGLWSLRLGDCQ
jgi:hypothetical protein